METGIQIRAIGGRRRRHLSVMYDAFEPLGAALGLPPPVMEMRRSWIERALGQKLNIAALWKGRIVGHCFLALADSASAELAIFVHQKFRRSGIGTALGKVALSWAAAAGIARVWSISQAENRAALGLQWNLGFAVVGVSTEVEMEIYLPAAAGSRIGR